jgi:hypothetical protein
VAADEPKGNEGQLISEARWSKVGKMPQIAFYIRSYLFASLAVLDYNRDPTVTSSSFNTITREWGVKDYVNIAYESASPAMFASGVVMSGDEDIIVHIRGHQGHDAEVPTALTLVLTDWPYASAEYRHKAGVHTGWFETTENIYGQVVSAITTLHAKSQRKRLWVTGYSGGGPKAIMIAAKLAACTQTPALCPAGSSLPNGLSITGVMVFGSPQPGNSGFAQQYAALGLRPITTEWRNGPDPVAIFPQVPACDYAPVGCIIHLQPRRAENGYARGMSTKYYTYYNVAADVAAKSSELSQYYKMDLFDEVNRIYVKASAAIGGTCKRDKSMVLASLQKYCTLGVSYAQIKFDDWFDTNAAHLVEHKSYSIGLYDILYWDCRQYVPLSLFWRQPVATSKIACEGTQYCASCTPDAEMVVCDPLFIDPQCSP